MYKSVLKQDRRNTVIYKKNGDSHCARKGNGRLRYTYFQYSFHISLRTEVFEKYNSFMQHFLKECKTQSIFFWLITV